MSAGRDRADQLRELVQHEGPSGEAEDRRANQLHRLCAVLVRVMPASGVGLTVCIGRGDLVAVAAAGAQAAQLEELQLTLGEGPCVDAQRDSRPVLEPDLAGPGAERWPAYGPAAHALGIAAVFAFPVQLGATHLGVLDVYQTTTGGLPAAALLDSLVFTDMARAIVLQDLDRDELGQGLPGWDDMLLTPALYQAQGMLTIQLGIHAVEAMARLRAHAYSNDQRLSAVADAILDGTLVMDRDAP